MFAFVVGLRYGSEIRVANSAKKIEQKKVDRYTVNEGIKAKKKCERSTIGALKRIEKVTKNRTELCK